MWILSQDRSHLYNVDNVYIRDMKDEIFNIATDTRTYEIAKLGNYSTYEKAISVLDMLKFSITLQADPKQRKEYIKLMKNEKSLKWQRYIKPVFQMPQDSEVE